MGRGLLAGAVLGLAFAALLTLARRLTWRPYAPIHLPYDVLVGVAGSAALGALVASRLRQEARLGSWSKAAVALSGIVLLWCAAAPRPRLLPAIPLPSSPLPPGRCVVLVVLDTVRRPSLALHGHGRRTTPNLDRWSQGALVFADATSVSSWTLPAHASMFTGLFPRSHGAHGYRSDRLKESTYRLPDACDTLAEIVSRAGLATAAVVANHLFLEPRFGTDQGFATYFVDPPRPGVRFLPADRLLAKADPDAAAILDWPYLRDTFVTDAALEAIEELRRTSFFLFVNYLDVHRPNRRPPTREVPLEDEIAIPRYFPEMADVLAGGPIREIVRRSLENAYDRELQHLDAELSRLLARLDRPDLAERTLVVVTSDHGEHFGEHGLVDHAALLYDETVDVPLIVKGPGVRPGRSTRPVQVIDVFPTALGHLGLPVPEGCQGTSLLGEVSHPVVSEWYAAASGFLRLPRYGDRFDADVRSIRLGRWRLIEDERGRVELYDLATDPRELHEVAADHPDVVAEARRLLAEWVAATPVGEHVELPSGSSSAEREEALRRTGYAGTEDPPR